MKYIFTIHSNITYISALGVITLRNLDPSDCLLFSLDYPLPQTQVKSYRLASHSRFWKNTLLSKFVNVGKVITRVADEFIGGDTFEVFAPCMVREATLFYAHPKCVKLNFIEEGLSAYYDGFSLYDLTGYFCFHEFTLSFRQRLIEALRFGLLIMQGYTAKVLGMPLFYTSYANTPGVDFYGFSSESYPTCRINKHVMSFRDTAARFAIRPSLDLNSAWIWLGEHLAGERFATLDDHMQGVENGFIKAVCEAGIKKVLVKFHHSQCERSKRATLDLFERYNLQYEIIDPSVIMEIELLGSKDVILYGCSSSLLVYGAMMGHRTVSVIEQIPHYPVFEVPIFNQLVEQ